MADTIAILPLAETHVAPSDLADLFNRAFAEYEGVLSFTAETMSWYLDRPGLGREHTFAAFAGGELVGGIMVTTARVVLGGQPVSCGIVDSVMTRPDRRRRGIATALMQHAIAWMRAAGLDASLLYTERDSNGHRIYARLGYVEHAAVHYFFASPAPRGQKDPRVRAAVPGEEERVRGLLNTWLGTSDGYAPVDPALWRWRRDHRPHHLPCTVFLFEERGEAIGTGTLCSTRVTLAGGPVDLVLITDVAAADPGMRSHVVRALLRRVPPGYAAGVLAGSHDPVLPALARSLGMSCQDEVAMVLPLAPAGEEALRRKPTGWYTLAESLIGI